MIRRVIRWGLGAAAFVLAATLAVLIAFGVPKPPSLTQDNVGRVAWAPLLRQLAPFERARSREFVAWLPNDAGVLVRAQRWVLDSRVHELPGPEADLIFLEELPANAQAFHTKPAMPYAITSWDVGGDERYQLFRWDLGVGRVVPLTARGEKAGFGAFEPTGPRIAYTSNRRNGTDFDVYVMNPSDPAGDRRVVELQGWWTVVDWSPSAAELLLAKQVSNTENSLHVLDLNTGAVKALLGAEGHDMYVGAQWSRDGRHLYYGSNRGTEFLHLRRLELATGQESLLSGSIPWDIQSIQQSADGSFLLVGFNEDGVDRHYLVNTERRELQPFQPIRGGVFSATLHPERPVAFVGHTDRRGVSRTYTYSFESEALELWTGPAPAQADVPHARLVRYPTFDRVGGEARQVPAFVYPATGVGPHPVVISIHGGPEAQARLTTRWRHLQKQGVTVIAPNVRGSTGYGRTYEQLDDGMRREDAVRDIGALLDWIETRRELDEGRVAVVGGSYGGYMVLASLVHYSNRIRCGVDRVGVSNFVTFLENTADYRRDLRRAEYGDERDPQMREFLNAISPLTNAERIRSRLMVVQGANDPRVPVSESRQLVERVKANGQTVAYVEAADEGHGFRKPWNVLYTSAAEQGMLRECLGG